MYNQLDSHKDFPYISLSKPACKQIKTPFFIEFHHDFKTFLQPGTHSQCELQFKMLKKINIVSVTIKILPHIEIFITCLNLDTYT